jgi:hypothetical protein
VLSGYLFMFFAAFEERPTFVLWMSFLGSMYVSFTRSMIDPASRHVEAGGTLTAGFIGRLFIVSLALRWSKVVAFGTEIGSTIGVT